MAVLRKNIDIYTTKYDNLLFFSDFNARLEDVPIKIFCLAYTLTNKINKPTCYKNHEKPSCVELILTNCPRSFQNSCALEIGLSDFHKMVTTVMITTFRKMEPKIIKHRDYNFFFNKIILSGSLYEISFYRIWEVIVMIITINLLFLGKHSW